MTLNILILKSHNVDGISHNYYQKFNVSEKGVVLNNVDPTERKVFINGKYVRDLSEKALAKIIINEVTSTERSLLTWEIDR
ncbi:MAG: hypothetical protein AB8W37_07295 [Arsenophonus endosymbiont of Dermacentor nuttalli]